MNNDTLHNLRHSLAHLLAAAVLELYPGTKNTIGPAIENGFYYDFEFPEGISISDQDLSAIQKKMKEILKTWKDGFQGREVNEQEARDFFKDNQYKLELIDEIVEKGEKITLYTSGEFIDLCRGGHVDEMKEINPKAFSLDRLAGAYWRGDAKNKMLTRIYGVAFSDPAELKEYRVMMEEAMKRDHRKIGQEQQLFFTDEMVGKGLIMWMPNGTIIRNEIERLAVEMERAADYERVVSPHMGKEQLYLTSGHLPYYKDGMYPAMEMDDGTYYLKAMNCPHHHVMYGHSPHSYRDLPVRYAEYGTCYRNELSGTLAGLLRVRGLAMNDAHIYCTKDQIKEEFKAVMEMTMKYFELFGLEKYWFRLSKWDPAHTDKYINQPENWEYCQDVLRETMQEIGCEFVEAEDEAAFYGPKVDVQFKSAVGREETMSTIQLDFLAKERFGLTYTDEKGEQNNEVFVIHRAPLSTHERFLAFIIEHYAGAFPVWLAPVQVQLISVGKDFNEHVLKLGKQLKEAGIRVATDVSDETVGKKIRNATKMKVPYMLVIGQKEIDSDMLAVRIRGQEELEEITQDAFVQKVQGEIQHRS